MKLKHKILLSSIIITSLSGCSSLKSEPSPEMLRIDQQQEQITTIQSQQNEMYSNVNQLQSDINSWKKIEPNVQRLVSIESELNSLIGQLATLTQETQQEARVQQTKQINTPNGKSYMLQLASLRSVKQVQFTWKRLQKKHPKRLLNLEARYKKVQVKGRTYYRLKVGNFSKTDATKDCQILNKRGVACIVASYSGITL